MTHTSACAVHNEPSYPAGPCNCGEWAREEAKRLFMECCHYDFSERLHIESIAAALIAAERRGHIKGLNNGLGIVNAHRIRLIADGLEIGGLEIGPSVCVQVMADLRTRISELEKATG